MKKEYEYDVFLSYARDDDEPFVKQLYDDLSANGYRVWWDRVCMPSRALKFTQEIRDAVEKSNRLLLIVGPKAVASDYVRYEWQHALLFAKGVVPILRFGKRHVVPRNLRTDDYKLLPRGLSKYHCPDFRAPRLYEEAFQELLRILAEPIPDLGAFLTLVPGLPPHFISRHDNIDDLKQKVLSDVERPTVITSAKQTTALQGMGGIGKSVLAVAFARATDTRRAFTDGIIWLHIGQEPDILQVFWQIAAALGENLEPSVARLRLPRLLEKNVCLIILDDVWNVEHARPIRDALGPRCRLLITTRHSDVVAALGAHEHCLDLLPEDEALSHLANWSGFLVEELPDAATAVAHRCGYLPLALSLCGAHVKAGVPWTDLLESFCDAELEFLDHPHGSIFLCLKVSVNALSESDRQRYLELAVFPEGAAIPEATIITLWQHTGRLKERNARQLLVKFKNRALLNIDDDSPLRLVSLHDLQRDYIITRASNLQHNHMKLIKAYKAKCQDGWHTGPKDGYFFKYFPYHLKQAGREEEFEALLFNFLWLKTKLEVVGPRLLIEDFNLALSIEELKNTELREALKALRKTLQLSQHVLGESEQLTTRLWGHLVDTTNPRLRQLLAQAQAHQGPPRLRPRYQSLESPFTSLICSMKLSDGHNHNLRFGHLLDGKQVLAYGECSGQITVLDMDSGAVITQIHSKRRTSYTCALAFGEITKRVTFLATAFGDDKENPDGVVEIWNASNGVKIRDIQTGQAGVDILEFGWLDAHTPILASGKDGWLKGNQFVYGDVRIWDVVTGNQISVAFKVPNACPFLVRNLEGGDLVAAFDYDVPNRGIQFWDILRRKPIGGKQVDTREERFVDLVDSPDGRLLLITSKRIDSKREVTVRDLCAGTFNKYRYPPSHYDDIQGIVINADNRLVIISHENSFDQCIRIRAIQNPQEPLCILQQGGYIGRVVAGRAKDGKIRIAVASFQGQVRVWDFMEHIRDRSKTASLSPIRHPERVECVAVGRLGTRNVVVSGDYNGTIYVTDLLTAEKLGEMKLLREIHTIALGNFPNGKAVIAAASSYYGMEIWDPVRFIPFETQLPEDRKEQEFTTSIAFSHQENKYLLATGSNAGIVRIWDLEKPEKALQVVEVFHYNGVRAVDFGHLFDGTQFIAAVSTGTDLKLLRIDTGDIIRNLEHNCQFLTSAVCGELDGRTVLAVGGTYTLKIWDANDGTEIWNDRIKDLGVVESLAIGHHKILGPLIAAVFRNPIACIWSLRTGKRLVRFVGDTNLRGCAMSPDGNVLVVGDTLGCVHVLHIEAQ